jgi:hypothetical protein
LANFSTQCAPLKSSDDICFQPSKSVVAKAERDRIRERIAE